METYRFTRAQEDWLAAMNSGLYAQARKRLRETHGGKPAFCCLGLGCHLHDPSGWHNESVNPRPQWLYRGHVNWLPCAVRDSLELRSDNGRFFVDLVAEDDEDLPELLALLETFRANGNPHAELALSVLNDRGWSFSAIAAFIRRNPRAVFKERGDDQAVSGPSVTRAAADTLIQGMEDEAAWAAGLDATDTDDTQGHDPALFAAEVDRLIERFRAMVNDMDKEARS
ncbi:MAG: hypothetical protein OXE57_14485 [Alphaproteobacteria bacterium]|nr:hypothetical protein [Alphaproteobacteria bacterium]